MAGNRRNPTTLDILAGWLRRFDPPERPARPPRKRVVVRPDKELVERRARYLLHKNLTTRQRDQLARLNYFIVYGGDSGEPYRIHGLRYGPKRHVLGQNIYDRYGFMYGIGVVSGARFWDDWKEHPLPPSDIMLAQKLLIETDERRFLRMACKARAKAR